MLRAPIAILVGLALPLLLLLLLLAPPSTGGSAVTIDATNSKGAPLASEATSGSALLSRSLSRRWG